MSLDQVYRNHTLPWPSVCWLVLCNLKGLHARFRGHLADIKVRRRGSLTYWTGSFIIGRFSFQDEQSEARSSRFEIWSLPGPANVIVHTSRRLPNSNKSQCSSLWLVVVIKKVTKVIDGGQLAKMNGSRKRKCGARKRRGRFWLDTTTPSTNKNVYKYPGKKKQHIRTHVTQHTHTLVPTHSIHRGRVTRNTHHTGERKKSVCAHHIVERL